MKFLRQDKAHTIWRATATRMLVIFLQRVSIVVGEFLSGLDGAERHDPNSAIFFDSLAIRPATMVKEPREIGRNVAIQVVGFVQREDEGVAQGAAAQGLLL